MVSGLFLMPPGGGLVGLEQSDYETEDVLQRLIAQYPELIPGDQVRPNAPRRWALVVREAALAPDADSAGRWSVDHLLLDQDGVPTLVEVKRSSDTRIRREVVGQLLEYAANAGNYWSVGRLRDAFVARHDSEEAAVDALEDLLQDVSIDVEAYWAQVAENIARGRLRLIFLADQIPSELARIIEFMNASMQEVEVLGVEVRRYQGGDGHTILVPRVIGQTQAAVDRRPASRDRVWDRDSFLETLTAQKGY